jgi:hypothetical protein
MEPGEPGDFPVLFLDVDISLEATVQLDGADWSMKEMRYLKNRVFFSTVRNAKKRFGVRR